MEYWLQFHGVKDVRFFAPCLRVSPRSNYAVPGLYFFDAKVCQLAAGLKPGARGELEITDLIRLYLERGKYRSGQYPFPFLSRDDGCGESIARRRQKD